MAKKEDVKIPEVVKDNEIAKRGETAVAEAPAWMEVGSTEGTEDISVDEIRLPRLAIAQGLSPQLIPGKSEYIDGLKLFQLFNDLTGEIYGTGPLHFVPIKKDVRNIEFIPRDEGGGIRDMDVPLGDERLEWSVNEKNEKVPPKATTFYEYAVMLLRPDGVFEPIVLSMKTTNKWNRRAVNRLNGFILLPYQGKRYPIYGKIYSVASKSEQNDQGTFGVYVIEQVGVVSNEGLYRQAKSFRETVKHKIITVTREPGDDDIGNDGSQSEM